MKILFIILFSTLICAPAIAQTDCCKVELTSGYPTKTLKSGIENNLSNLLRRFDLAFANNDSVINFDDISLTQAAREYINTIWNSGKFKCTKADISETLLKTESGYEVRNIPILLDSSLQQLVFAFDHNANITDIYFSVMKHQYKNITTKNRVVDETKKNIIRDFLESFRTAYIKKDINFINMVFSDKALIVVGKKIKMSNMSSLKISENSKPTLYESGENSVYKKMTKEQYINGLKNVFKRNKKIKVDFEDIEIIPHRKLGYEEFYGVRLKQRWQSDNYEDYGIIFFVIQFREAQPPLIWVRVWQDANTTPESEQIGLGDILIQPN